MNRKSFLAAGAATLPITLGLSAAPQASAAQPTPANNIVDVAIAVNSSGPYRFIGAAWNDRPFYRPALHFRRSGRLHLPAATSRSSGRAR